MSMNIGFGVQNCGARTNQKQKAAFGMKGEQAVKILEAAVASSRSTGMPLEKIICAEHEIVPGIKKLTEEYARHVKELRHFCNKVLRKTKSPTHKFSSVSPQAILNQAQITLIDITKSIKINNNINIKKAFIEFFDQAIGKFS